MDHVIEAAAPAKYKHINFKPPEGVRKAAKRGLEMRKEHGRGGTAVGVARARDLMNGKQISPSTARRMKAYFDRHQPDQKAEGFDSGDDGYPSAGRVAWELWGGDAGYSWAKKLVKQMNSADEKGKVKASGCGCAESCDCGCQAPGGGQPPSDMTISNLKQIIRDAEAIMAVLHEDMEIMGWAEDKVSQAKAMVNSVRNYIENDFVDRSVHAFRDSSYDFGDFSCDECDSWERQWPLTRSTKHDVHCMSCGKPMLAKDAMDGECRSCYNETEGSYTAIEKPTLTLASNRRSVAAALLAAADALSKVEQ